MKSLEDRISALLEISHKWLFDDNHYLIDAIDRTVREGYFSFEDVTFALDVLKENISREALEDWAERSGLSNETDARGQNVLCLHAGNLPLVGFQNALSTLLSGARYTGKISRKDPYLLPTFLNEVKKTSVWSDMDVQWTHRMHDFEDMSHDAILFAGSSSSVPGVKQAIDRWNLASRDARYLIRTAHFSMAYVDPKTPSVIEDLTESIFRYGGNGCRSVAVVVSPYALDEVKNKLKEAAKAFWRKNPQHQKKSGSLAYQAAYNEAVGQPQLAMKYFLLQEGEIDTMDTTQKFRCYWIQGDEQKAAELANRFGDQLQSLYAAQPDHGISGYQREIEQLEQAQRPPISWKPDGTDTLQWLAEAENA